jgi:hypothetical protein
MAAPTLDFLSLLFGHPSLSGLYLNIWERQRKTSSTFALPAIAEAAARAESLAAGHDVYFGTCPYVKVDPGSRGLAEDAGALIGVWLDVDVKNAEAHKSEAMPETDDQAFDLIYEMPAPPSLIVHSGFGLQAWWLLETPYLLKTPAERIDAAAHSVGWVQMANRKAARHGWKLDPVGDLARVLRVPGTRNHKGAVARPVAVVAKK